MAPSATATCSKRRWHYTDEMRLTICLTQLFFETNFSELTAIFNTLFSEELSASGIREGLQPRVIESQLSEFRHRKGPYLKYSRLHGMTASELRSTYLEIRNRIEDAAAKMIEKSIQLKLRLRTENLSAPLKIPACRPVYKVYKSPAFESRYCDEDSSDEWRRPKRLRHVLSAEHPYPSHMSQNFKSNPSNPLKHPPIIANAQYSNLFRQICRGKRVSLTRRKDQDGNKVRQYDALLFRVTSTKSAAGHGLRAGLFKDSMTIPPPAPDEDLKAYFQSHLLRLQVHSPLISLYSGPKPVFSRALQMEERFDARILIVDGEVLEKSLQKRFPGSNHNVFVVDEKVDDWGLSPALKDHGYVAWATIEDAVIYSIPVNALKTFFTTTEAGVGLSQGLQLALLVSGGDKMLHSKRFEKHAPRANREIGLLIGAFIDFIDPYFCLKGHQLGSSARFREVIAAKIAAAWKLKGSERWSRGRYADFMSGVFQISLYEYKDDTSNDESDNTAKQSKSAGSDLPENDTSPPVETSNWWHEIESENDQDLSDEHLPDSDHERALRFRHFSAEPEDDEDLLAQHLAVDLEDEQDVSQHLAEDSDDDDQYLINKQLAATILEFSSEVQVLNVANHDIISPPASTMSRPASQVPARHQATMPHLSPFTSEIMHSALFDASPTPAPENHRSRSSLPEPSPNRAHSSKHSNDERQ